MKVLSGTISDRIDHRAPVGAVGVGVRRMEPTLHQAENGNHILKGLRIFRTGSFKDSAGIRRTWTPEHLDLMVSNFYHLGQTGRLPDIPVRSDHSSSIGNVIGYFKDVYRDPEDPKFLCADVEFTEHEAADKWRRRTFRARSAEIGRYEDNDGNPFFPAILGLAFVDFGAVEGLHGLERSTTTHFSYAIVDKEYSMNLEEWIAAGRSEEDWVKAVEYAAWIEACNYAQALEDHFAQAQQLGIETTQPQSPTPPATPPALPPAAAAAAHRTPGAPGVGPAPQAAPLAEFRINGNPTTDYSAVQAHIHTLEGFVEDNAQAVRTQYVNALVNDKKLPQTRLAAEMKLVATMSPEQFTAYRESWDVATVDPLFQTYGASTGGENGGPASTDQVGDLDVALEIVTQHKLSGRDHEFIKGTPSFKKLEAAGKAPVL